MRNAYFILAKTRRSNSFDHKTESRGGSRNYNLEFQREAEDIIEESEIVYEVDIQQET